MRKALPGPNRWRGGPEWGGRRTKLREKLCCSFFFFFDRCKVFQSRQKFTTREARGFFFLPEFYGFMLGCLCGAVVPCCAFSVFLHIAYQNKKLSTLYVRAATARDARRMWRPSCFLLKHGGGTPGIIKSPACNCDHHKKKVYAIMDLCQTQICTLIPGSNFDVLFFLSERSGGAGRRRSEAPCIAYEGCALSPLSRTSAFKNREFKGIMFGRVRTEVYRGRLLG